MQYFRTVFLEEAEQFLLALPPKVAKKVLKNIRRAEKCQDDKLFKKLNNDIWEFRSRNGFSQIRLLAFWDKTNKENSLVFATHGFMKKADKIPGQEIQRAINLRNKYFDSKK